MVRQVRASTSGRLSEIPKTNRSNPPDPSAADTHPFRETAPVVQVGSQLMGPSRVAAFPLVGFGADVVSGSSPSTIAISSSP